MGNFDILFNKMNTQYAKMEAMMSDIDTKLQENPEDTHLQEMLQGLGDIALSQLSMQMDFAEMYCEPSIKDYVIGQIIAKQSGLTIALVQSKGRTK